MKSRKKQRFAAIPFDATLNEKYGPAMKITTEAEAQEYFERCVEHAMSHGASKKVAIKNEKSNIGYYAGYHTPEVRERVERLFKCEHPIFGSVAKNGSPTLEEAFEAGLKMGRKAKRKRKST